MFRERKALAQAAPFCVHQGFPEWAFTHQQQGMSSTAQASKSAHLIPKEKPPFRLAGNAITHNLLQSKWIAAPTSYAGLQESKGPKSECVHTLNQDVCHPLAPACTILFLTIAILLPVALLPGGGGGAAGDWRAYLQVKSNTTGKRSNCRWDWKRKGAGVSGLHRRGGVCDEPTPPQAPAGCILTACTKNTARKMWSRTWCLEVFVC